MGLKGTCFSRVSCFLKYHVVVYRSTTAAGSYLMCIHSVSSWTWLLHRMSVPSGKWFMWCELLIPHRVQSTGSSSIFILICFRFCSKTSKLLEQFVLSPHHEQCIDLRMQFDWFSITFAITPAPFFFIKNWTQPFVLFSNHCKCTEENLSIILQYNCN